MNNLALDSDYATTIDGVFIHYYLQTRPERECIESNKPLILIHPGLRPYKELTILGNAFYNAGYPIIGLDPRGFGSSDKPRDSDAYSLQGFARDLEAIVLNAYKLSVEGFVLLCFREGFLPSIQYLAMLQETLSENNALMLSPKLVVGVEAIHKLDVEMLRRLNPDLQPVFLAIATNFLSGMFYGSDNYTPLDIDKLRVLNKVAKLLKQEPWDVSELLRNIHIPLKLFYNEQGLISSTNGFEIGKLVNSEVEIRQFNNFDELPGLLKQT